MTQAADDPSGYPALIVDLRDRLAPAGLDLLQPLQAGWYNDRVHENHRLADFADPASLVVLVGNTRRLWPKFVAALQERSDLLDHDDPLDAYVEETVTATVRSLGLKSVVRWSHRPAPHHIAIQQMAEIAGLAWRSPAALSIHPVYGPWIALRAAIVVPLPGPPLRALPAPACTACPSACLKVLNARPRHDTVREHQLAVRDACPIGRQYRYPNLQIAYHYSKSKASLRAAVNAARRPQGD